MSPAFLLCGLEEFLASWSVFGIRYRGIRSVCALGFRLVVAQKLDDLRDFHLGFVSTGILRVHIECFLSFF